MTGKRFGAVLADSKHRIVGIGSEAYMLLRVLCEHEIRSAAGEITILIRREAERLGLSLDGKEPSTDATH